MADEGKIVIVRDSNDEAKTRPMRLPLIMTATPGAMDVSGSGTALDASVYPTPMTAMSDRSMYSPMGMDAAGLNPADAAAMAAFGGPYDPYAAAAAMVQQPIV